MWTYIIFVFGLAAGHVGAGYMLHAEYPRAVKILAIIVYSVGYLLITLRPVIESMGNG